MQMLGKSFADGLVEHEEYLAAGQLLLFSRQGIFQARIYQGDAQRRYLYRSLKTRDLEQARKLATQFYYEIEFRKSEQLPIRQKTFGQVIDEYIELRQQQYDRSQRVAINRSHKSETSIWMLRQIKRVSMFWKEYCGKKPIDRVDNAVLKDYVQWRRDYYHNKPRETWPKNARPNPADKTLEWEIILAKTLLRYAHERGYRGQAQLPTWRFKCATRIVRPAFTVGEMAKLQWGFREWIRQAEGDAERHYHRQLLRHYVDILAKSGLRVGEANNLLVSDVQSFTDGHGQKNYQLRVKGKTGARVVIPLRSAVKSIEAALKLHAYQQAYQGNFRSNRKAENENKSDWLFRMLDGNRVITLIDQFKIYLQYINTEKNRYGERYTLYSLRHFYASRMLEKNVPVFDIARNMGTSVQNIELYHGRSVTARTKATMLGG
jgi:integrase